MKNAITLRLLNWRTLLTLTLIVALSLVFVAEAQGALTFATTTITSDGNLTLTPASGSSVVVSGSNIVLSPTFTGSSSKQSVEADATLSSFTGGYGAAVMGNLMGTIGSGDTINGGLIGKYNVTSNSSDHPSGAVLAEIGEEAVGSDGAFIAYIGGDGGVMTSPAAFTVRTLNSTAGSYFTYGIDFNTTTIDSYQPVSFGTADIRLVNGETIDNTTNGTVAVTGALSASGLVTASLGISSTAQTVTPDADSDAGSTITAGVTAVDVAAVTTNADDWIVLPAIAGVPVGHTIYIACTAGGNFEVRTPATSNTKINNEDSDGTKEYLCTDTDLLRITSMGATQGWVAQSITVLGAVRTAVVPD